MSSKNLLEAILAQSKLSKKETVKQQKIVETAIAMFAEKGYANTSTKEIATASGVSEGTLFRHYGTKENLLLAVILPFLKESIPSLAEELQEQVNPEQFGSFEGFLRALLTNRMQFIKANKEIFQIIVKEFLYRDELRKGLPPLFDNDVLKFLNQTLDLFKARGELVDLPNPILLRMIFTCIGSHFVMRFLLLPEPVVRDDAAEIDHLVRFITNGVQR
ncbi:TetR/AcrR family transcriptional regulator [Tumebacillus permanentifrigoris]|uniref:TetR family transcriptional regulator n=1 Tax=Tumebacillus permanentifrigoris TaxID=378543 RepID=A0A316DCZ7_9BACL|nr:TetR/AcrR family transcriptional regulator [Tumebacillus permanentifrigoris]PWK15003.1 TetR family transcriptional regulator [Tumebacillus permanentifrigoris]